MRGAKPSIDDIIVEYFIQRSKSSIASERKKSVGKERWFSFVLVFLVLFFFLLLILLVPGCCGGCGGEVAGVAILIDVGRFKPVALLNESM